MKVWKIAIVITLALSLTLGVALPGLADPDETPPPEDGALPKVLRGSVVSIDDSQEFFVIQSREKELTISVDDNTKYFKLTIPPKALALAQHRMGLGQFRDQERLGAGEGPELTRVQNQGLAPNRFTPGESKGILKRQMTLRQLRDQEGLGTGAGPNLNQARIQESASNRLNVGEGKGLLKNQRVNLQRLRQFGEEATLDDITVGARVAVRVVPGEDKPVAKLVLIMQSVLYERVIGTVTDISSADKTITIAPADGSDDIILNYNEETRFVLLGVTQLEEGQLARAVYDEEMTAKVVCAPVPVPAPEPTE